MKLNKYSHSQLFFPTNSLEILKYAPEIDIIVGRRPELEWLDAAIKLKMFIFPGTGVDGLLNLMKNYKRKDQIIITNTHRSAYNCAQHAIALLFGVLNKLIIHHEGMKHNLRNRDPPTTLIKNKNVGLLGYGPINQYVHRFLSGFEVRFSILKRSWNNPDNTDQTFSRYTPDKLHEFLEKIEILIIALPLTKETRHMLGAVELEKLGRDSYLVNVARGEIIDQATLYHALKSNKIAGAGLDVWYYLEGEERQYGYSSKFPFDELKNTILSPHRANSGGNITRWDPVLSHIYKFLEGEVVFENHVDVELGY